MVEGVLPKAPAAGFKLWEDEEEEEWPELDDVDWSPEAVSGRMQNRRKNYSTQMLSFFFFSDPYPVCKQQEPG